MKQISKFSFLLLCLPGISAIGQTTVSGTVQSSDKVPLPGASVSLQNTLDGTTTDSVGHFSFATLETGTQMLEVNSIGFESYTRSIDIAKKQPLDIVLKKINNTLAQVTITAGTLGSADGNGKTVLDPLDVVTTAGSGADPVAAMQMLPGVQKSGTQTGMMVRGGDASEAAIVVDGLTLQNPFFTDAPGMQSRSRFNVFQFKGIAFSSGGYSARYGQAMSSVLEMNTLDLPDESTVNVGLHMAGIYASADKLFNGDQMSISATASYFNLSPFYKIAKTNFDFYDVPKGESGALNYIWKTKKGGLLKVKGNYSRSASGIRLPNPFEAGTDMNFAVKNENAFGQASFLQRFGTRFKWFTAASYSYNNDETKWGDFPANTLEKRAQARTELNWYAHTKLDVLAGIEASAIELEKTFDTISGGYKEQLVAGYLEAEWRPVYWLAVKPGLRLEHSGFLNTTTLAPRLSASVRTGAFSQASVAGGMFYQNPDKQYLWEKYKLEQQLAIHYIANWMYSKSDRTLRVEAYYKDYQQLVREYGNSYDPNDYRFLSGTIDNSGHGYAEGLEVFFRDKKTVKNLDFWLSYSYINTKRLYKNFPTEATPSFIADHNLSVVGKYWIDKITTMVSGTYSFASGKPYYDPNSSAFLGDRTPAYNNLALQASYLTSVGKWFMVLYAGVDNVLNQKNVFGYRYSADGQSRYPIVPALYRSVFVGVNFSLTKFDKDEL